LLSAALVFLACLGVYLTSLCPTFLDDDSPETVTAAYSLGLQHPPSYALWVLFQRLFCLLPLGNPCFRVNLASAWISSLTVVLLMILMVRLIPRVFPPARKVSPLFSLQACAAAAALSAGFSRTFLEKALGAKGLVYGGAAFLTVWMLLCLENNLRQSETRPAKHSFSSWTGLAFFLFGLGCCGHWQTQVLFFPILLFFFREPFQKPFLKMVSAYRPFLVLTLLLMGLSPLLYLPLKAHLHPVLNLGSPDTIHLFKKSMLREYVNDREKGLGPAVLGAVTGRTGWQPVGQLAKTILDHQGRQISGHFVEEMKPLVLLLSLGGLGAWLRSREKILLGTLLVSLAILLCALLSVSWIVPGPLADWYANNYLMPVNWITAIFAAAGLFGLGTLGGRWIKPGREKTLLGWTAALLCLPLPLWWSNSAALDLTRQDLHYDYGVNLLKSLPKNSVFFAEGDEDYFPLYYLQVVENMRPDVTMIPAFTLFETWGVEQTERFQPQLGLKDLLYAYPDPYHRIESALTGIMTHITGRQPVGYSYFDGAFHHYYLASHPSLLCEKSGILLLLASPEEKAYPALPLRLIRARHWANNPSNGHPALQGIWSIYNLAAQPSAQGVSHGL
jgi:hypothetical protein